MLSRETTGCLMFLPVSRMKLRSSGIFRRKAVSHLAIDRFGPSCVLETVWKRKESVLQKHKSDCRGETTHLQRIWSGLDSHI